MTLNLLELRRDFPMLATTMHGKPLVYLDNAATTQKPRVVIERMDLFYREEYATINRGVYGLSQRATQACDDVREKVRAFLNAGVASEIIFTKGTTEAINLVAASFGRKLFSTGQEIILSTIEHHSNIVPWQRLAEDKGLTLKIIPVNDRGELVLEEYENLLSDRTAIVAVGHISNALGTVNPIAEMIRLAHQKNIPVLIDGAQGAPHAIVDVRALDCDFYCFSGHKLYGPTGIGVLYAKQIHLERMDPYQSGGDMIEQVTFEKTTYAKSPAKFEAGTPPIAQIVGLGTAIDYIETLGRKRIAAAEQQLLTYATEALGSFPGIRLIGTAREKAAVISFVMEGVHPHDIGTILDEEGIAIRAGHHCAQPTMKRFGVAATVRASFAFYNIREEVDLLMKGLEKVRKVFGYGHPT